MTLAAFIAGPGSTWLLAAAAAVVGILVIHLRARRRPTVMTFPAARFARAAAAEATRKGRLRDALLFMLRAGAALSAALAFSRPLWQPRDTNAAPPRGGSAIVIAVDASASMQRAAGGTTLFEVARERARELLARLDAARDLAGIITIDSAPDALLPELTANISRLAEDLDAAAPTLERGDAAGALARAEELLSDPAARGLRRSILVLSDMQASQWRGVTPPRGVECLFEPIVGAEDANTAVTAVRVSPERPRAGREAIAVATIANFAPEPRSMLVRFVLAGAAIGEAFVDVPAMGEREAPVRFTAPGPGWAALSASIDDAGFAWDNTGRAGVRMVDAGTSVLMTKSSTRIGETTAAWFVRAALEAVDGFPPRIVAPPLIPAVPEGTSVLVLADAGVFDEADLAAFERFARQGGTLIWFVGAGQPGFGPRSTDLETVRVARGAADQPLSESLSAALRLMSGARVPLAGAGPAPRDARGLLESSEGSVLWRRALGAGSITGCTIDPDPSRSPLPRDPAFPALLAALLTDASAESTGGLSAFVGEYAPDSRRTLDHPGDLTDPDHVDDPTRTVGINLDPRESDFRVLQSEEFPSAIRGAAGATQAQASAGIARPIELWPWLLAAAGGLLIVEHWLRPQRHIVPRASGGARA